MGGPRVAAFTIGLGLLALAVAVPALLVARAHGFDGLYGQDAFAYVDYGLGPLRAALLAGRLPPGFALPPGYPLVVALVSLAFGPDVGVAQGISLLAGAALPVLVALLALEVMPERGRPFALLAGLLAAVAGQLWQSSLVTMADTTAVASAALGGLAACRFARGGGRRWLVVAAVGLALATETRLVFAVVAAAFGMLAGARLAAEARVTPGRVARTALLAIGAAVLALAPAVLPIAGAIVAGRSVPFTAELGVAGLDPLTALRSSFVTADGHLDYAWPMLAWEALQPVHWYWLGILGLAVPVGLVAILRQRDRPGAATATLLGWPGLVFVVLVLYPYQNPRFFLAMLPPVAILGARGLDVLWGALRVRTATGRVAGAGLLVVAIGLNAALAWRYTDGFVARQAADIAAIRTLEAMVPPGARLASIGATPLLRHDGRTVVELFDLAPADAAALVASRPFYLLVDPAALRDQWAGTPTGRASEILAAAPGLTSVGAAGAWTLYQAPP